MIVIDVPGYERLELQYLLLDYNGTIAVDGEPKPGTIPLLKEISNQLEIHIITADTFNRIKEFAKFLPSQIHIIPIEDQKKLKADFVEVLGAENTIAIGNGANDSKMLKLAKLGILVIEKEGASIDALTNADLVFTNIIDALESILNPKRIVASLRR
ncbi:MAG: HAD family hydrolase [Candidatus Kapaibacteriales bacterium]